MYKMQAIELFVTAVMYTEFYDIIYIYKAVTLTTEAFTLCRHYAQRGEFNMNKKAIIAMSWLC